MRLTAATRLFALLGDPVRHSLSPLIQNAALEVSGIDAVYVALETSASRVAALVASLADAGGGGNVTIPHKLAAAAAVDRPEPAVTRTGACNTFWGEKGSVRGDNTDVVGFRVAALRLAGSIRRARVLIVGAGGAARAAACAVLDEGGSIDLLARSMAPAVELRQRLDPEGTRIRLHQHVDAVRDTAFDLIVNATPLGLHADDPPPLPLETMRRPAALMDLVYAPRGTGLVRAAHQMGIASCDGSDMLLAQAAASFERWFDVSAPVEAMRRALAEATM